MRSSLKPFTKGVGFTKRPIASTAFRSRPIPAAKKALQDIYNAEDREHAAKAVAAFAVRQVVRREVPHR
jgi:hypothetical protein